jgi:hypothetical protein
MPERPIDVVTQLTGELLRESAALIAVFAPLDLFMQGARLTIATAAGIIASVSALFSFGVLLEVRYRCKR